MDMTNHSRDLDVFWLSGDANHVRQLSLSMSREASLFRSRIFF